MKKRKQRTDLPDYPVRCAVGACVYKALHHCDSPRINKGNSDAACHEWSNVAILRELRDERGSPVAPRLHTRTMPA